MVTARGRILPRCRGLLPEWHPTLSEPMMLPRVRPMLSAAPLVRLRVPLALGLLCLLAACTSGYGPTTHRHGGSFAGPARYYPPPGPAEDPWGPYIREASGRYGVPEQWIRQVMRQES